MIKAQVLIGGRGKAGGIKVAKDADEARAHADAILGMDIVGPHGEGPFRVHQVWVEEASEIDAEYYASIILDRSAKMPLVILSRMGGMNVEAIAESDPDALVRRPRRPARSALPTTTPRRSPSTPGSTRTSSTGSPRTWSSSTGPSTTSTRP